MSSERDSHSPSQAAPLRTRVLRGTVWTVGGFGAIRLLRLASNLILTRLLFPEAFGLMLLLNVILLGLGQLSDLGLRPNVVRSSRGDDPDFLDTAWTIQVVRGFALWMLASLAAWPAARFYGEPDLALLLPVAASSLAIHGFQSTSLMTFSRQLAVGKLTVLELTSNVVRVSVMLVWAWIHPTVWALIGGGIAGAVVTLGLSHLVSERRNRFSWDRAAVLEVVQFGKWIFISTILSFFSEQLDRFIFGKTIPLAQLGVYSIAVLFSTMPSDLMARFGHSVIFPALSRKKDGDDLVPAYNRSRMPLLVLSGSGCAVLAACGSPLIETLYDSRYSGAGWIVQILALGAWLRILEVPPGCAMLAIGKPRWIALGHAAKVSGIALFIPAGFSLGGFPGAVVGLACSQMPLYAIVSGAAHAHGFRSIGRDLLMTMLLALAAFLGALTAAEIGQLVDSSVLRLLGAACASSLCWGVTAYGLLRRDDQQLGQILRHAMRQQG